MNFSQLLKEVADQPRRSVAVAGAHDEDVLRAIEEANKLGIVQPILVGDEKQIKAIISEHNLALANVEIIDEPDPVESAKRAVMLIRKGRADFLMKGMLQTADMLRAVLDKEYGLRMGTLLSHVTVLETPQYDKLFFVTDGGMVMYPDVKQKAELIKNAVYVAQSLGVDVPKVAVLAAVELVNPDMPATLDAAVLTQMNQRGQIKNCVVDGPLALDNAVSVVAAAHKGIVSDVAGAADIMLVPNIEAGNMCIKAAVYLGGCVPAGLVVGARAPIVVTSRADSAQSKLVSIACAAKYAAYHGHCA